MEELLRPPAEETKRRWKKLERDLADKLEGWLTIASGSKWDKGDAKSHLFLGECKYRWCCEEDGFYIPMDIQWLEAIWRHAQYRNKTPLLALEWGNGNRACLVPSGVYEDKILPFLEEDWRGYFVRKNRIIHLPEHWSDMHTTLFLTEMEVQEYEWVMFPWEDLSWLRLEELEVRKEIGRKSAEAISKLPKTKKVWSSRPFPKRRNL